MALIKCYECNNSVSDKAFSCPHCGAPLREYNRREENYPPPFYQMNTPRQRPYRNVNNAHLPVQALKKDRITAGLLALFLGGIGVHKFYLGKGGQGLLYLLFFWSAVPAIISFFEAIGFFIMSDEEFYHRYLQDQ